MKIFQIDEFLYYFTLFINEKIKFLFIQYLEVILLQLYEILAGHTVKSIPIYILVLKKIQISVQTSININENSQSEIKTNTCTKINLFPIYTNVYFLDNK